MLKIGFVGNFQNGYSGEIADEVHIARSFEELGHLVYKIPRDEWREYVLDDDLLNKRATIPQDIEFDIIIICKWHHFFDGSFIKAARIKYNCPVFYWVWDSVDLDIDWHRKMAQEADLYLSGELGRAPEFMLAGIKFYYFQFDCIDWSTPADHQNLGKIYNVIYVGSFDNQRGRMDLLKSINKEVPIHTWGNGEWEKEGFIAHGPLYGEEINKVISQSKIILGTSCDPHLFGYWSNRVGRILRNNAYLLQQYTPGMESFLHNYVDYFSTAQEAIEKIHYLLKNIFPLNAVWPIDKYPKTHLWTSRQKVTDLSIMIERYLKEDHGKDWKLP